LAIYHASTKPVARSAGRSAVAAAAYRAGCELTDDRSGLTHDYRRKGGIESAEVILADGGTADRAALWNAAEAAEKRRDSRTAREWVVALPAELGPDERRALARSFALELASRYGVAADVAIHAPDREGDNRNHHAHILTTTRQVSRDASGALVLGSKTAIELGDRDRKKAGIEGRSAHDIGLLRERWAVLANSALERAGHAQRIDHRSLAAQGIDREPTQHLGPVASQMERRGRQSDRGDGNRQAAANSAQRAQLAAQLADLGVMRKRRTAELVAVLPDLREYIEVTLRPQMSEAGLRATMQEYDRSERQRELGKVIDPGAVRQVLPWLVELKKDAAAYQVETIEQVRDDLVTTIKATEAHTEREPLIFGREKWSRENNDMRRDVRHQQARLTALLDGDWTKEKVRPRDAAIKRVQAKFPELADRAMEALRQVAAQLASHARRIMDEHSQKLREQQAERQRQLDQERQRNPRRDRGGPSR